MGEALFQLLNGLQKAPPGLDRLADAGDVERLGLQDEAAHEGAGVEDRLERHRVGEGAQELARIGHRRALAQLRQDRRGEALAGGAELLEAVRPTAQVGGDLGPGGDEAALLRLAHVVADLEAVADRDEARERLLLRLLGAGSERQPDGHDAPAGRVLEHQGDEGLAGLPGRASALGGVADPAEAVIAHGTRAAARGGGVQRQTARVVPGQHGADGVEDRRLARSRRTDERGRPANPDLLAPDEVPVRNRDVGEAIHRPGRQSLRLNESQGNGR